jgi:hypothetical protein
MKTGLNPVYGSNYFISQRKLYRACAQGDLAKLEQPAVQYATRHYRFIDLCGTYFYNGLFFQTGPDIYLRSGLGNPEL